MYHMVRRFGVVLYAVIALSATAHAQVHRWT